MQVLKRFNKYALAAICCLSIAACNTNDKPKEESSRTAATETAADRTVPAVIPFDIVKEYPHDPGAFTEGLEYKDGFLYESTGEYGVSDIRKQL